MNIGTKWEQKKARIGIHHLEDNFCKSCPANHKSRRLYTHCITNCEIGKIINQCGNKLAGSREWCAADDCYLLDFYKEHSHYKLALALNRDQEEIQARLAFLKEGGGQAV